MSGGTRSRPVKGHRACLRAIKIYAGLVSSLKTRTAETTVSEESPGGGGILHVRREHAPIDARERAVGWDMLSHQLDARDRAVDGDMVPP